jgi:hypothetical protein
MGKKAKFARMLLAEMLPETKPFNQQTKAEQGAWARARLDGNPMPGRGAWSGLTTDEQAMLLADAKHIAEETRYWGSGFGDEGLRFLNPGATAKARLAAVDDELRHVRAWLPAGRPIPEKNPRQYEPGDAPEHAHLGVDMMPRLQDASIAIVNERAASANRVIRSTPVAQVGDKAGVRWGYEHGNDRSINDPAPKRRKRKPTKAEVAQVEQWSKELNAAHEAR